MESHKKTEAFADTLLAYQEAQPEVKKKKRQKTSLIISLRFLSLTLGRLCKRKRIDYSLTT